MEGLFKTEVHVEAPSELSISMEGWCLLPTSIGEREGFVICVFYDTHSNQLSGGTSPKSL